MSTIYLYIKQHSISGLKYFGRTIKPNPFKYPGSGSRWSRHLKKHGKQYVKTLEIWGFDDQELCTNFALKFSEENNIVESKEWANLIPEDGTQRYNPNFSLYNHSDAMILKWKDEEYRNKRIEATKRVWKDDEYYRNSQCEIRKDNWKDEEYRNKTILANKNSRLNQEYKDKVSNIAKLQWADEEFKAKQIQWYKDNPKMWVTNEIEEATISIQESIPDGWRKGRKFRSRTKKT